MLGGLFVFGVGCVWSVLCGVGEFQLGRVAVDMSCSSSCEITGFPATVWAARMLCWLPSESVTTAPLSCAIKAPAAVSHGLFDIITQPSIRPRLTMPGPAQPNRTCGLARQL